MLLAQSVVNFAQEKYISYRNPRLAVLTKDSMVYLSTCIHSFIVLHTHTKQTFLTLMLFVEEWSSTSAHHLTKEQCSCSGSLLKK